MILISYFNKLTIPTFFFFEEQEAESIRNDHILLPATTPSMGEKYALPTDRLGAAAITAVLRGNVATSPDNPHYPGILADQIIMCRMFRKGNEEYKIHTDSNNPFQLAGLPNHKGMNRCFFNSTLQLLRSSEWLQSCYLMDPTGWSERIVYDAPGLLYHLQESSLMSRWFAAREQQDAAAFLRGLLFYTSRQTHNETDSDEAPSRLTLLPHHVTPWPTQFNRWLHKNKVDHPSPLYRGVLTVIEEYIICSRAHRGRVSYILEPMLTLPLTCFSDLEDMLRVYTQPAIMEGKNQYACDTCGNHVNATKYTNIVSWPDLLFLELPCLPHARQTSHRGPGVCSSHNTRLPLQWTVSNGKGGWYRIQYRLCGLILHHGSSPYSGHYQCCVVHHGNGGVTLVDDDVMRPLHSNGRYIDMNSVYVAAYERTPNSV